MTTNERMTVNEMDEKTSDAYSYDRYSRSGWRQSIKYLQSLGFDDELVEEVLRSKIMRWAADSAANNRYGRNTSKDLQRYLEYNDISTVSAMRKFLYGS